MEKEILTGSVTASAIWARAPAVSPIKARQVEAGWQEFSADHDGLSFEVWEDLSGCYRHRGGALAEHFQGVDIEFGAVGRLSHEGDGQAAALVSTSLRSRLRVTCERMPSAQLMRPPISALLSQGARSRK